MADIGKDAIQFVVDFLKYYDEYDIRDKYDKQHNIMETSAGVLALVRQARAVLPKAENGDGHAANQKLTEVEVHEAIEDAPEKIIDLQKLFAKKVADNGAARGILERVLNGDQEAMILGFELIRAEKGEKNFESVPTKE